MSKPKPARPTHIFFDGGYYPHSGLGAHSWLILRDNETLAAGGNVSPSASSFYSEMYALHLALSYAVDSDIDGAIMIFGDNKPMMEMFASTELPKRYHDPEAEGRALFMDVSAKLDAYATRPALRWIPRRKNQIADRLGRALLAILP